MKNLTHCAHQVNEVTIKSSFKANKDSKIYANNYRALTPKARYNQLK